jgi:hypothetical protein
MHFVKLYIYILNKYLKTPEGYSSTDQILDLFPKDHQFESHKSQGHWRLIWSLTSGLVKLVEVRAS